MDKTDYIRPHPAIHLATPATINDLGSLLGTVQNGFIALCDPIGEAIRRCLKREVAAIKAHTNGSDSIIAIRSGNTCYRDTVYTGARVTGNGRVIIPLLAFCPTQVPTTVVIDIPIPIIIDTINRIRMISVQVLSKVEMVKGYSGIADPYDNTGISPVQVPGFKGLYPPQVPHPVVGQGSIRV